MAGSGSNKEEYVGSLRKDHFVSLERRRDCEANRTLSVQVDAKYTNHTSRSHSRPGIHVSHDEETRNLRLEIDQLRKKLCCKQRDAPLPSSETDLDEDRSYK